MTTPRLNASGSFRSGMVAMLPVIPGMIPFGMITGIAAINAGFPPLTAQLYSMIVFAGASQIAAAQLISDQAQPLIIILTIWIINLRFMMYSASINTLLPPRTSLRLLEGYFLTDQSYAISISMFNNGQVEMKDRAMFYLGSAIVPWIVWQLATGLGIVFGSVIPESWSLEFGVSLCFIAIMIPALRDFPAVIAAVVGGTLAMVFYRLPFNLGLIVASAAGIAAGYGTERYQKSHTPQGAAS